MFCASSFELFFSAPSTGQSVKPNILNDLCVIVIYLSLSNPVVFINKCAFLNFFLQASSTSRKSSTPPKSTVPPKLTTITYAYTVCNLYLTTWLRESEALVSPTDLNNALEYPRATHEMIHPGAKDGDRCLECTSTTCILVNYVAKEIKNRINAVPPFMHHLTTCY